MPKVRYSSNLQSLVESLPNPNEGAFVRALEVAPKEIRNHLPDRVSATIWESFAIGVDGGAKGAGVLCFVKAVVVIGTSRSIPNFAEGSRSRSFPFRVLSVRRSSAAGGTGVAKTGASTSTSIHAQIQMSSSVVGVDRPSPGLERENGSLDAGGAGGGSLN